MRHRILKTPEQAKDAVFAAAVRQLSLFHDVLNEAVPLSTYWADCYQFVLDMRERVKERW